MWVRYRRFGRPRQAGTAVRGARGGPGIGESGAVLISLILALALRPLPPGVAEATMPHRLVSAWSSAGSMAAPRNGGTATLLPDGRVLAAGGACCAPGSPSAELYDPRSGAWTVGPRLAVPRYGHSATLLPTGQVLMAGGDTTASELYLSPGVALSPSPRLTFGPRRIGGPRALRDITVADDGPITLTVHGATVVGPAVADFAVVSGGCAAAPLAPGGHYAIEVAFAPRTRGTRVAEVRIADTAPGGVQVVALSGSGNVPPGHRDKPRRLAVWRDAHA